MVSKTLRHLSVSVQNVHISASFFLETILAYSPEESLRTIFILSSVSARTTVRALKEKKKSTSFSRVMGRVPVLFPSFKKYLKSWDIAPF